MARKYKLSDANLLEMGSEGRVYLEIIFGAGMCD